MYNKIDVFFALVLATAVLFSCCPSCLAFSSTVGAASLIDSRSKPQGQQLRGYHHHPHHRQRQKRRRWSSSLGGEGGEGRGENDKMRILGVCGGIGSGKSTACKLLVDSLGCVARIDADKLAHVVYEPGSDSLQVIAAEFGDDIIVEDSNGIQQIDRKKLGAIVFSDAGAMSKLERIVWPHVRTKIEERIGEITSNYRPHSGSKDIVVVEAALLLETDWHDLLDGLWVVRSSRSTATRRLMEDRGLSEEEASVRIDAQQKKRGIGSGEGVDDELKELREGGVATAVIANDGTLEDLQRELEKALRDPASFKS